MKSKGFWYGNFNRDYLNFYKDISHTDRVNNRPYQKHVGSVSKIIRQSTINVIERTLS